MTSDNILVAIKIRPFIDRERREKLSQQWNIQASSIFQVDEGLHRLAEPYSFDHIFTEEKSNEDVYYTMVKPLVKSCLEGFNSTIFAYGQTTSGKTHTMMGNNTTPGIIKLAVNDIFNQVQQDKQRRYLITCSFFEIYNERINDLLDANAETLKIREDYEGNTFISAKEEVVTIPEQVYELMAYGNKTRKIGSTCMNERSSRSHTIFRFTIESTDNSVDSPVQVSQLNLVDLAGSERVAHSKAEGKRLQEGVNINKSLSVLGKVIRQLSDNERYISYRDSKLTRLLQQALGGNAKSLIIATITIAAGEETKSTLEFAQRAKSVKNKPIINEVLTVPDKLKKYELLTAGYKQRLTLERQRMKEMETKFQEEKIAREREIEKLKHQCKLVDLFTKGPVRTTKPEIKVPRRHTVGHYGHVSLLETIPELSVVPSTSYGTEEATVCDESTSIVTSRGSDVKTIKYELEETSSTVFAVSPEPTDDTLLPAVWLTPEPVRYETEEQGGETPPAFLRKRIKSLEESYMSLKEFTKLEAEYNETDKNLISDLQKEKANLLKDCEDLNAIIKSERTEKEKMKLMYEERENSLKIELEHQKKENTALSFRLGQSEAENDLLKVARGQDLIDHEFVLEERTKNYEKQLEYLRNEIKRLNEAQRQAGADSSSEVHIHKITKLDDTHRLTEDVVREDEETTEILSKSSQTENIENEADNELRQLREERVEMQRETECIKEKMTSMRLRLESMQSQKQTLLNKIKDLELDHDDFKKQKAIGESQLQKQLNDAHKVIEQLNEKLAVEMNFKMSLSEELDDYIRDMGILTELLTLGNTEDVERLLEAHQGLLELFESQVKSHSEEMVTDCNIEMDQFIAYLLELKNVTDDVLLNEEIDLILLNLENSAEDFVTLLEGFVKSLSNSEYTDILEKLNSLQGFVREKTSYIAYMEQQKKQFEGKVHKQRQYLKQFYDILLCIDIEKRKDKIIKDLESRLEDLSQKITKESDKYEKKISHLKSTVAVLKVECDNLKSNLEKTNTDDSVKSKLLSEVQLEKTKTLELNKKLRELYLEKISLTTRINELENTMKCSKSLEILESQKTPAVELSPKEVRRRKRQSLQDERRGINSQECGEGLPEDENLVETALREEVNRLTEKVKHLTTENDFLEYEVQGFIRELDDAKASNKEKDQEIELLKQKIGEGIKEDKCNQCISREEYIKNLEELHKSAMFKIVNIQTKIYDLENAAVIEKTRHEDVERILRFKISKLEEQLGTKMIEVAHSEVQCNLLDYDALIIKYNNLKKLARLRREEGNILRAKLGMDPDAPLQ